MKTSQELRKAALRVVGCQGVEGWKNSKTQIVKKISHKKFLVTKKFKSQKNFSQNIFSHKNFLVTIFFSQEKKF